MARRRYQKGSIRKRGKRHPVWELQWWTDYIGEDGKIARKRGIDDPRLCVRDYAAAGFEARRRASAPAEYGESDASLKSDVRAIRRASFRPEFPADAETFNAGALPAHTRHSPFACLRRYPVIRDRESRCAAFCFAENGTWPRVGNLLASSQSHVEGFRDGEAVGIFRARQSGARRGIAGKESCPGKARSERSTNSCAFDAPERAMQDNGSFRGVDRLAGRGNSRPALEGCRSSFRRVACGTGCLSGHGWFSENKGEPSRCSPAGKRNQRSVGIQGSRGRIGVSDSGRNALPGQQSLAPGIETGWREDRRSVVKLAYAAADPRNPVAGGWRLSQGCVRAAWAQQSYRPRTKSTLNPCPHINAWRSSGWRNW